MKKEFIECKTRKQASEKCPWASKVTKAYGGYWAFENITDWEIWKAQK